MKLDNYGLKQEYAIRIVLHKQYHFIVPGILSVHVGVLERRNLGYFTCTKLFLTKYLLTIDRFAACLKISAPIEIQLPLAYPKTA